MDVLKKTLMVTLAAMLVVSFCVYLLREDIFINSFKLHIGAEGVELNISAKEKSDPPRQDDHSNKKIVFKLFYIHSPKYKTFREHQCYQHWCFIYSYYTKFLSKVNTFV